MFQHWTNKKRLLLGLFFLLVVDLLWVGSSELTEFLFKNTDYNKPFFTTYVKTTIFTLYLSGFICRKSWRQRCHCSMVYQSQAELSKILSDPVYVPINDDDGYSSIDSSDNEAVGPRVDSLADRRVRFNDHMEVRVMSEADAEEANLARLPYELFLRAQEERARVRRKYSVPVICKLAVIFCGLWFLANFSYQEALLQTEAGVVNILSSLSGLFTLILAAIWSSGPADKFTLSKLFAVLFSAGGTVMICLSDMSLEPVPIGAIWSVVGSLAYALYLVTLKRKVPDEGKLDIPMFFGFVGLFNMLLLWPGLLILHFTQLETFILPTPLQWLLLVINGLIGTMLSELLWLWGCFLTSSLLATLALGLVSPLTMLFDIFIKKVTYSWMFYAGMVPVIFSFVAITVLSHYHNWDPVLIGFKKFTKCITRLLQSAKLREMDSDVTSQLLSSQPADFYSS
ncbi:solute carrier family 35 member F5-like [Watersipora subatra]|uniref:solute carrier family 35 member F5-like n=1 Tax=Watersipora subatra TaxID=2589382 RepID=UPI00355B0685